ncbi:MAG: hypothetical protein KGP28_09130, partial [Bdellovibrionales bacterium]|nr:hypothetical protein [Bdellovibrionales bacterium]
MAQHVRNAWLISLLLLPTLSFGKDKSKDGAEKVSKKAVRLNTQESWDKDKKDYQTAVQLYYESAI